MHDLFTALASITNFLRVRGIPHMVVGGLANLVWGQARLTEDVDLTIWDASANLDPCIKDLTEAGFVVVPPDPAAFAATMRVLPLQAPNGIKIDLILAMLPMEKTAIERALPLRIGPTEVPVCTAEDLIILKAVSTRLKDQEDVRGIIDRMGKRLDLTYLLPILRELGILLDHGGIAELCRELEGWR